METKKRSQRKVSEKTIADEEKYKVKERKVGQWGEQSEMNMQIIEQEERLERVDGDS